MYTTLEILKELDACKPGFGRMIRFFGLEYDRKARIPLHVIALVGGHSDVEWVLSNALIIDPQDFQAFYRRTLPGYFRAMLKSTSIANTTRNNAEMLKLPGSNMLSDEKGTPMRPIVSKKTKAKVEQPVVKYTETLMHELYAKAWHLCGFDNQDFVQPPHQEFLEFIEYAHSLPDMIGSNFERFLLSLTTNPQAYIRGVLENMDAKEFMRDFSTVSQSNMFGLPTGTPAFRAAHLFQPTNTFEFLRTTPHRTPSNVQFEMLPGNRVRVVKEFDVESIEYLNMLRGNQSVRDQDVADDEDNTIYPDYTTVTVHTGDVAQIIYQVVTPSPTTSRIRLTRRDTEDDDSCDNCGFHPDDCTCDDEPELDEEDTETA